jgi:hypothetical protein
MSSPPKLSMLHMHCVFAFCVSAWMGIPSIASGQHISMWRQPLTVHENCNEGQKDRIERAGKIARTAAFASLVVLGEIPKPSPFYRTWFGDWSQGNGARVQRTLGRMWSNWDIEFRCGGSYCDAHPSNAGFFQHQWHIDLSHRYYVCNRWYSYPPLSVEGRARATVLIHEISHGVGTNDIRDLSSCGGYCYTASEARELAKDVTCENGEPYCKAIYNAENYARFASDILVNIILVAN